MGRGVCPIRAMASGSCDVTLLTVDVHSAILYPWHPTTSTPHGRKKEFLWAKHGSLKLRTHQGTCRFLLSGGEKKTAGNEFAHLLFDWRCQDRHSESAKHTCLPKPHSCGARLREI